MYGIIVPVNVTIDVQTEDEVGELAKSIEKTVKRLKEYIDYIEDMSQVVQDNFAMAEETSATSEELAAQSVTLNELVKRFDLNEQFRENRKGRKGSQANSL